MPLVIANREPQTTPLEAGVPVWRTCLREVGFADDQDDPQVGGGQRYVDGDAYRLLLQILCGLESPMIGETQVLGQFRSFLGSLDRQHGWLNRLGQRLLTDARDIRTKHLQGLGSRSYGSAIRRHLVGCQQAILIGTGKLAHEVMPFLSDAATRVDHWGRSADGAIAGATVTYRLLDAIDLTPECHAPVAIVIAAPVPSAVIAHLVSRYSRVQCVIDLRAEMGDAPLVLDAPIISLHQLFDEMQATQAHAAPQVSAARAAIAFLSRRYELREESRPFGWEDLCA